MKKRLTKFAQVAGIMLALVFTFSCSSGDDNNGGGGGSGGNIKYGSLPYEGKTYKIIKIGNQTWMAENLDYNVAGSVCYGGQDNNCTTYGRLYKWAIAMALPPNCDSTHCSSQVDEKHKGICPNGWHIPSTADWDTLITTVGGESTAGTKLKAVSGWYSKDGVPSGTDDYGFTALPGSDSRGDYPAGAYGNWWSATEYSSGIGSPAYDKTAYERYLRYDKESAYVGSKEKRVSLSVRCVKDN